MAIPAIGALTGSLAPASGTSPAGGASSGGKGFGGLLAEEIGKLDQTQAQASSAAESLATGKATDISTVTMQVEEASLSLQLATQVRNKVVDAYNELFGMQI